jgi:hypothetical protein
MAQQIINVGSIPNDGQGDPLRTAYIKINQNFEELYGEPIGGIADNVYYVSKSGSDSNNGNALGLAFLTILRAVQVATAYLDNNPTQRVCIFVKSGDYTEINPIVMPRNLTIVGDNLRSVSVRPLTPNQDIFQVQNADYITGITFRDHVSPAAAVAYPSGGAGFISTSPYIQNCSSITTTGAGMRIDGNLASGLKSMVSDAYTQVNEGGIGVHILNQGYAQLVSIFTVCCQEGILVENGAYCSITNSNTSFGTFGLVARGKVATGNTGFVAGAGQIGSQILIGGLSAQPTTNQALSFDGGVTLFNIFTATPISGGQSLVTISESLSVAQPDATAVTFFIRSAINASSHTFEWVGTGNSLANALPATGAMPIQANEVQQLEGGVVVFTSTDQRGDFRIGDQLTINGSSGTITGETFDKSLFAVLTPYVLALEG